jgi:hypothetical protein
MGVVVVIVVVGLVLMLLALMMVLWVHGWIESIFFNSSI